MQDELNRILAQMPAHGGYATLSQKFLSRVRAALDEQGMNASRYQSLAARTLIDRPDAQYSDNDIMVVWNAIGLAGEAGEVAELVKKGIFHQHGLDKRKMYKELGDVLWYVAALCTKLDFDMGDIMQANIDKLRERYPDGYSSTASQERTDVRETTDASERNDRSA